MSFWLLGRPTRIKDDEEPNFSHLGVEFVAEATKHVAETGAGVPGVRWQERWNRKR